MSASLVLLILITLLYAGYNFLIKISTNHVPNETASTILATIALQVAALAISCLFAVGLITRGVTSLQLPASAYVWAVLAGLCIGAAEIAYFYLFRGFAGASPFPANVAIPFIVSGTVVITVLIAWLTLQEPLSWQKGVGMLFVIMGVATIYLDSKLPNPTGS